MPDNTKNASDSLAAEAIVPGGASADDGWRPMRADDLPAVLEAQRPIYPTYQERREIFAERLELFPAGCLVLPGGAGIAGYAISHPWREGAPPKLDTPLGALPAVPTTYYLHDIALLPPARGKGAGVAVLARLIVVARAEGLATLSLTAVQGSAPYWARQGFVAVPPPPELASYGDEAVLMVRPV
jgi:GNAT superfamily N-acetyltransferase